jgi:hypothetical protein
VRLEIRYPALAVIGMRVAYEDVVFQNRHRPKLPRSSILYHS